MERRAVLAKAAGGLAAAIVPKGILPFVRARTETSAVERFSELWREGHLAFYFSENRRAFGVFQRAFALAAGLDSERQADSAEMMFNVQEARGRDERQLADQARDAEVNPTCLCTRLQLADTLQRLGRYDEAEAEYQKVLSRSDELEARGNSELYPRLGWYHYRGGRYPKAAEWFERTPELLPHRQGPCDTPEELLLRHIEAEATLNRLLVSLALGRSERACSLARVYISKLGRLPWPYRWHLFRAGIDADTMYVETWGRGSPGLPAQQGGA